MADTATASRAVWAKRRSAAATMAAGRSGAAMAISVTTGISAGVGWGVGGDRCCWKTTMAASAPRARTRPPAKAAGAIRLGRRGLAASRGAEAGESGGLGAAGSGDDATASTIAACGPPAPASARCSRNRAATGGGIRPAGPSFDPSPMASARAGDTRARVVPGSSLARSTSTPGPAPASGAGKASSSGFGPSNRYRPRSRCAGTADAGGLARAAMTAMPPGRPAEVRRYPRRSAFLLQPERRDQAGPHRLA